MQLIIRDLIYRSPLKKTAKNMQKLKTGKVKFYLKHSHCFKKIVIFTNRNF